MIKKARNIFFEYFYNLVETIVNEDFANAASEMAFYGNRDISFYAIFNGYIWLAR